MDVGDDEIALTQIGKCRMPLFMFANHVIQVDPPVPACLSDRSSTWVTHPPPLLLQGTVLKT